MSQMLSWVNYTVVQNIVSTHLGSDNVVRNVPCIAVDEVGLGDRFSDTGQMQVV